MDIRIRMKENLKEREEKLIIEAHDEYVTVIIICDNLYHARLIERISGQTRVSRVRSALRKQGSRRKQRFSDS